jgi:hypothetical protein
MFLWSSLNLNIVLLVHSLAVMHYRELERKRTHTQPKYLITAHAVVEKLMSWMQLYIIIIHKQKLFQIDYNLKKIPNDIYTIWVYSVNLIWDGKHVILDHVFSLNLMDEYIRCQIYNISICFYNAKFSLNHSILLLCVVDYNYTRK